MIVFVGFQAEHTLGRKLVEGWDVARTADELVQRLGDRAAPRQLSKPRHAEEQQQGEDQRHGERLAAHAQELAPHEEPSPGDEGGIET